MREQTFTTEVKIQHGWGESSRYLTSDKPTFVEECERGVQVCTDEETLMYVAYEHLISVEFNVKDEDAS
jgi:hypothetical protein